MAKKSVKNETIRVSASDRRNNMAIGVLEGLKEIFDAHSFDLRLDDGRCRLTMKEPDDENGDEYEDRFVICVDEPEESHWHIYVVPSFIVASQTGDVRQNSGRCEPLLVDCA